ncbi:MmgE/PrpD family protein [Roseobacteraceae bacterium S113]
MGHDFASWAHDLTFEDLPEDVLWTLRRSTLDTMGVAAIGATTTLSDIARRGALALFGAGTAGGARMLMDGRATSPAGAAMAGAFTIDAIDAHDGTTPNKGHGGSAIFPALLAVADAEVAKGRAVTGADFTLWLAVAYELSYRAGQVQHATAPDYHTSGAWTAVGVAAAVAQALGGTSEHIRHAAGIGEYHGPRSQMMRCIDHPTMLRDGVGWGAPSGVTAAYLALEGFTGAPALTCEGPDAAPHWADLGSRWRLVDDTHYKAYPCCRWAHPALDGVAHLMAKHALHHQDIKAIEIRTFHYATRLAGHAPQTLDEFSYAIAFPVAAMAVRGTIGPNELTPETLKDPAITRLARATTLIDDPDLTARSVKQRWAQVTLVSQDGTRFEDAPRTPRGDPDQPLSDTEIAAKYEAFTNPVLPPDRRRRLAQSATAIDTLTQTEFTQFLHDALSPLNPQTPS